MGSPRPMKYADALACLRWLAEPFGADGKFTVHTLGMSYQHGKPN